VGTGCEGCGAGADAGRAVGRGLAAHPTAVDREDRAGDVVACRGAEEEGCSGEVGGLAPATGGDAFEDLAVAGLVGLEGFGVGGGDVAGSDGVDLNAFGGPLVGEGLGELGDAALGSCVGRDADAALEAEEAGDVDDLAASFSGHDVSGDELGELEDAGEVDLQDVLPGVEGSVDGGVAVDGAGVVDEDVDATEVVVDAAEEGLGACGVGEIGLEGGGGATGGGDGGGCFGCGAAVAVNGDAGSGFREGGGDGCAEAAGGSGDEGNFVVEAEGVEDGSHEEECSGLTRWGRDG
jgi:hypothetical protein